jgi:predicted RNA-binding Zn-ribbon protein involved in translation (DUF1610 family)
MLAALDRWSEWKRMREAPGRIDELEKRLAALETSPKKAPGRPCPACGEPAMRRISIAPDPGPFGDLGTKIETWRCSECGDTEEKMVTP